MRRLSASPALGYRRRSPARERVRGAIGLLAAVWLAVAVAALGAIDVGYQAYMKRNLQAVADMAATAGSQAVDNACTRAPAAATGSAGVNGFVAPSSTNALTATCGRWDSTMYAAPTFFKANATPANAVSVTVTQNVPLFFMGPSHTLTATATAEAVNMGAFTIGTTLASVGASTINNLLNALLGTNLNLSLVSYQALANARIKIGDLVSVTNAGTVKGLLAQTITVNNLAKLMVTALSTTTTAQVDGTVAPGAISALQSLVTGGVTNNTAISVGSLSAAVPGLLSITTADTQSALNATISPFDALIVAAEVAQAGKGALNLAGSINLGLLGSTTVSVQVIQPPVLAIGEAGVDSTGAWRTLAHSAQVRVLLNVSLATVLPGVSAVNLPLAIEAAPGTAWLVATNCGGTKAASTSSIGVQPGIANACVATFPPNPSASTPLCGGTGNIFSSLAPAALVSLPLGIALTSKATVAINADTTPTLVFDGIAGNSDDFQSASSNNVGYILANTLSTLLGNQLVANLSISPLGSLGLGPLLSGLGSFLTSIIGPLLGQLDTLIVPLLQLLGVQIGTSTIHDLSLTCGQSQLVY